MIENPKPQKERERKVSLLPSFLEAASVLQAFVCFRESLFVFVEKKIIYLCSYISPILTQTVTYEVHGLPVAFSARILEIVLCSFILSFFVFLYGGIVVSLKGLFKGP